MIKQQQRQRQHLLRCQRDKLQLVDLVLHLQHQAQEDLEVHQRQQGSAHQAGLQHLALRHQVDSAGPVQALVQVQQLERARLGQAVDSAAAEAGLEAHLASVARRSAGA